MTDTQKTILLTGATDGIGLETARLLVSQGHRVLLHGRNPRKLEAVEKELSALPGGATVETYVADLSRLSEVAALAAAVSERHTRLDVLINNAGVFRTPQPLSDDGLDVRFVVNTVAPYLLTRALLPLMTPQGRVVSLSSAAQTSVQPDAIGAPPRLSDSMAYAQSKLALTMWSRHLADALGADGPTFVAVNPGSMLATKMVKEAYGVHGADISIGANILIAASFSDAFEGRSGAYFDNDRGRFAPPHPDASDPRKVAQVMAAIEAVIA